jgi:hypothetical protein
MRRRVAVAIVLACVTPASARAATVLPPIRHVFILMLENKSFNETFGRASRDPYLASELPSMGALLPNYFGVTHMSLGNYVALISGQGSNPLTQADCQIYMDVIPGTIGADGQAAGVGCVYPSGVQTIADQLEHGGMTWKGYMEDMRQPCRHPTLGSRDTTQSARVGDQYAARHNPFVYFHSIIDSPVCAANDVPLDQLRGDLASSATTPNYSFITPNLCDDGHDARCVDGRVGGLTAANAFLAKWVPRIIASAAYRSGGLLVITFDESDGSDASACCGEPQFPNTPNNGGEFLGRGGGRVGAVMLSPYIDPGTVDYLAYNHFTLLRSFEDLFGLPHLGYAAIPGARALGADLFTCFAPPPRATHGRLPRGSEIKSAAIQRFSARRPALEIKLWRAGRITVRVPRAGRRRGRLVVLGRRRGPCQPLVVRLPYLHGRAVITARAFGGVERRTLSF